MLTTKKNKSIKNLFEQNKQQTTKPISCKNIVPYLHTLMKELNINAYHTHMNNNSKESFSYVLKKFANDPTVLTSIKKNKNLKKIYNQIITLTESTKFVSKISIWKKGLIKKERYIFNKNLKRLEQKYNDGSIDKKQLFSEKKILQAIYKNKIKDLKTISTAILSFAFHGQSTVNKEDLDNYKNLISKLYSNDEYEIIEECTDIVNMTSELLELKSDLVVKYYLQALDKAVKAQEKKYNKPHSRLNAAAISFLKKIDLINSIIYLFLAIQQIISLTTPFLKVALPYISKIFVFLPILFIAPRIIINIGKSLYYHQKNKNWDYFHSVKFQILEDLILVASSIALTFLTSSTFGVSMLIHPMMIKWIVQSIISIAAYIVSIGIQIFKKHKYNKEINGKITDIDFKIDVLIKKNSEPPLSYVKDKKYKELLFLKKKLTAQKNKQNKIFNMNIFLFIAAGVLSPILLLGVGKLDKYNEKLNKLVVYSDVIVPVYFFTVIQEIASGAIANKLNSITSFFKNRNKKSNESKDELLQS